MNANSKSERRKKSVFAIVLTLLIASTIYAIIELLRAPSGVAANAAERVKSDYVLMILQCVVGSIVIFLPRFVEKKFHFDIPNAIEITYFLFLFCAIYLGEVRNFYFYISYWDTILHFFSAMMLGAIGFTLIDFLAGVERFGIQLNAFFISFFAFCFSLACGAIWEVYEFLADGVLGTNMQKFITYEGRVLEGRVAVSDTMEDIIITAIGALLVAVVGYFQTKKEQEKKQLKNRS